MILLNHSYKNGELLSRFIEENSLTTKPSLFIQCFASHRLGIEMVEAKNKLLSLLPHAHIIGTTTAGIIQEGMIANDGIVLSFSVFDHSITRTQGYRDIELSSLIEHISEEMINDSTSLLVVFAHTFRFDSDTFLKMLNARYPNIPIVGGNSGDDFRFEDSFLLSDLQEDCDVVIAAIESDRLEVSTHYLSNWEIIGQEMKVTKAIGNNVYEIDGHNIFDLYAHYLGEDVAKSVVSYGIEFPLIYSDGDVAIARAPVYADPNREYVSYAGIIPEGCYVNFAYANVEDIEQHSREYIRKMFPFKNEAMYIYSCAARYQKLGNILNDEISDISQIAPASGFITYGEFFHEGMECNTNLLNITTTFVTLNESRCSETLNFLDNHVQKEKKETTLKALTTLVKQVSNDLNEKINYLKQFKNAVNESSIFSTTDNRGIIKEVNRNFELTSGYARAELIGSSHNIVRSAEMSKEAFKEIWKTIKKGNIWKGLIKNSRKDGSACYLLTVISPIYNIDGSFKEYISIRQDVTELEEYKQFLKHKLDITQLNFKENIYYMKQYEEAISSVTAVLKTDTNNIITYANPKFCELIGYQFDELIGQNCSQLRDEKHRLMFDCENIKHTLKNKNSSTKLLTSITKDGAKLHINTFFHPILDSTSNVVEHLQIMHDLTETITLNKEIIDTQREVVLTLGAIGETRSQETGLHVRRVAEYSYLLAKLCGLSEEEANLLKQASPMHDIGKVGIPDNILNKPGKLTAEEFEVMKTHAQLGYEMLKHSERTILKTSAIVAYTHHEKWDGSGYPQGLKGKNIPIYGRITAIADVFDALSHDRVYKKAWPLEQILELFRKERGKHFDPEMIDLFFNHEDQFLSIRMQLKD